MAPAANLLARDLDEVLVRMGPLWEDLRDARLFITGGTGFFGCWLLETLLWAHDRLQLGARAVVLTRDPAAFERKAPHLATHPAVTLHPGDVRTFAFPEGTFTHVVHAAVDASPPHGLDNVLRLFDTTTEGTRHVLHFAHVRRARRFLLTSSGAVYGYQPPEITHVSEDFIGAPKTTDVSLIGAEAKRVAESLCAAYASSTLQPLIARCFAFLGPYLPLNAKFAAGNFIRDAVASEAIRIQSDGTSYRSYMYALDLAVWLWTILLRAVPLRPYNVGSDVPVTITDLAHAVASHFTPAPSIHLAGRGSSASSRYVPNTARARHELGLFLTIGLDEAIARTVAWHACLGERS